MNTLTVELSEETFSLIPKEIREEITLKTREPKDYDYSKDEEWIELNKASYKAYKKKKEREYQIRKLNGDLN